MSASNLLPLKRFVDLARPITYGIVQAGEHDPEGVPYIRPVDMTDHDGVPDVAQLQRTSPSIALTYKRSEVKPGDIVVSIGPSYGKTMIVPPELAGANLTQGTARVAVAPTSCARYICWALQTSLASASWDMAVGGATFRALNLEPLSRTPIPSWPIGTQRVIADFLDTETARIDALIAKKQRMTQIVAERLRLLAHDLTANADTRMPLRRVVRQVKTGTTPPADVLDRLSDGDLPWYSPGDVGDWLTMSEAARTLKTVAVQVGAVPLFPADSALVVGIGATAGKVAHLTHSASGNQQMTCVVPGPGLAPRFLSWQLFARAAEMRATAPFTTLPILNNDFIRSLDFSLPDIHSQEAVVAQLDVEAARTIRLARSIAEQVALLTEHRQALLTAAVTGKLQMAGVAA